MGDVEALGRRESVEKLQHIAGNEIAMFGTTAPGAQPEFRQVATQGIDDAGTLWFFSRRDSDKNRQIAAHPTVRRLYTVTSKSEYLCLEGVATISRDQQKIDALWSGWAKTWFTEGKEDPNHIEGLEPAGHDSELVPGERRDRVGVDVDHRDRRGPGTTDGVDHRTAQLRQRMGVGGALALDLLWSRLEGGRIGPRPPLRRDVASPHARAYAREVRPCRDRPPAIRLHDDGRSAAYERASIVTHRVRTAPGVHERHHLAWRHRPGVRVQYREHDPLHRPAGEVRVLPRSIELGDRQPDIGTGHGGQRRRHEWDRAELRRSQPESEHPQIEVGVVGVDAVLIALAIDGGSRRPTSPE